MVMVTVPAIQSGAAQAVHDEFLDLVCADEELLRAEFDAIIAQEWSSRPPPADPPAASRGTGPRQGGPAPPVFRGSPLRPRHPGVGGWGRQRSPPPAGIPHQGPDDEDGRAGGWP
jgi:hypothetical protein